VDSIPPQLDRKLSPWFWVPSLYFAQALPNVLVTTASTYAYTRLGISAVVIGYTAWLGIPWMLKPLWSPIVELIGTERRWVWMTQFVAAGAFLLVAWGFNTEHFMLWTAVGYLVLAVASATHDIAADGYYMRVLSAHDQTWFTGIRSVAFRGGWIFGEGVLVMIVGILIGRSMGVQAAWATVHALAAAIFFVLATYHLIILPQAAPKPVRERSTVSGLFVESIAIFRKFFQSIPLATAIPFLLFYRFAEVQLGKFAGKFMLDPRSVGGLGLVEQQVGAINGVFGISAMLAGGVLGSLLAARYGLKKALPWMVVIINVPNVVYVLLSHFQPESLLVIGSAIVVEKFGYGFGFTGYMLYMLYLATGDHKTSFYAFCTGIMTLGLIFPQSLAGYPLQWLGYSRFFIWIMLATIPSFIVTWLVYRQLDPAFGRREEAA
jgi:PAT family beta-lactamase induction signal transducer AmpG